MRRHRLLPLALLLAGAPRPAGADAPPASPAVPPATAAPTPPPTVGGVGDADVAAGLAAAGANRGSLEGALARARARGDARRIAATRFLVANLPGKGYVITRWKDAKGTTVVFDPLRAPTFRAAQEALDALEQVHGALDVERARIVSDAETVTAAFLEAHVDRALAILDATPSARRPEFRAFLEFVLPWRGSEEPLEAWLPVLRTRFEALVPSPTAEPDAAAVWRFAGAEAAKAVRFDERYYLHPTDQGFAEMERTKMGRCEDITNRTTYAARALGLVTAADYTPAWGHRDNNHAWPVLLDAQGRGFDPSNAHAAKVYRKTFSIRKDALKHRLPAGRVPPNRFLGSDVQLDVTDQYAATTDVEVELEGDAARAERFAYLCVFNGGEWTAIQHGDVEGGRVVFRKMGRGILYLPAVHDGTALVPAGSPRVVGKDGRVTILSGTGAPADVRTPAVSPEQHNQDTRETRPVSFLATGKRYTLSVWRAGAWTEVGRVDAAGAQAPTFSGVPADGLFWLVEEGSRRLERPFGIRDGAQRFW